jgi:hypothetical protein
MNHKVKVPSYNQSSITIDKSLNGKIKTLENNSEYQELHGKLRALLSKSEHLVFK